MRASFSMTCTATYNTGLDVPDELIKKDEKGKLTEDSKEAIVEYINAHLEECEVHDLEWLSDDEDWGGDISITDEKGNEEIFFAEYP